MSVARPPVKYAKSGDVHIAYQVVGDGPIDLVYVPGFTSHLDLNWEPPSLHVTERLSSFSRLTYFDKRGTSRAWRARRGPSGHVERTEQLGASPGTVLKLILAYMEVDVRHVCSAISAPTLILHAHGDRVVNVRQGRWLAEHIPGSKYVELPGIDHAVWFTNPDPVLDEIEEFLTGVRPLTEPDRVLATVISHPVSGASPAPARSSSPRR